MNFENSGFPDRADIRAAFRFLDEKSTQKAAVYAEGEIKAGYKQQIDSIRHSQKLSTKQKLVKLESIMEKRTADLKRDSALFIETMNDIKREKIGAPLLAAITLAGMSGEDRFDGMAALMIAPVVDSPLEYMEVEEHFNENICGLVADLCEVKAVRFSQFGEPDMPFLNNDDAKTYDSALRREIKKISDPAKLLVLLEEAADFVVLQKEVMELGEADIVWSMGIDTFETRFNDVQDAFGINSDIDDIYMRAFNNLHKLCETNHELTREDGKIVYHDRDLEPLENAKPGPSTIFSGHRKRHTFC